MNESSANTVEPSESSQKKNSETWEWTKALVIAVILALLIRSFLFESYVVDGDSMLPNLHDGERLIVNKISYTFGMPQRGDMVVFHATEDKDFIKRVIAVPGDTIELINDELTINGKRYDEPYLKNVIESAKMQGSSYNDRSFGPIEVPEGHVVVFGDNRPNSHDSRDLGPIPLEKVVGRADLVFWPIRSFHLIHE
jgi:signal peptidase I